MRATHTSMRMFDSTLTVSSIVLGKEPVLWVISRVFTKYLSERLLSLRNFRSEFSRSCYHVALAS